MIHVAHVPSALAWYARAFPAAVRAAVPGTDFEFLTLGGTCLEFVPADAKVSSGPAGTVVYWSVPDFEAAVAHFRAAGATPYRGPLRIARGESICQMQDPWGNCIGLRGPSRPEATMGETT